MRKVRERTIRTWEMLLDEAHQGYATAISRKDRLEARLWKKDIDKYDKWLAKAGEDIEIKEVIHAAGGTEVKIAPSMLATMRKFGDDTIACCKTCSRTQCLRFENGLKNEWSLCHGLTMPILYTEADIELAVKNIVGKAREELGSTPLEKALTRNE